MTSQTNLMQEWQLQEAKAKLSELIKFCQAEGPQEISVRGKAEAVIMACKDFEKLFKQQKDFVSFMQESPLKGLDLDMKRDTSSPREIDL